MMKSSVSFRRPRCARERMRRIARAPSRERFAPLILSRCVTSVSHVASTATPPRSRLSFAGRGCTGRRRRAQGPLGPAPLTRRRARWARPCATRTANGRRSASASTTSACRSTTTVRSGRCGAWRSGGRTFPLRPPRRRRREHRPSVFARGGVRGAGHQPVRVPRRRPRPRPRTPGPRPRRRAARRLGRRRLNNWLREHAPSRPRGPQGYSQSSDGGSSQFDRIGGRHMAARSQPRSGFT